MDLEALMRQVAPLLQREIGKWAGTGSRMLLENEAKKIALKAFESFDPGRGLQLSTHLMSQLQKLSRTSYARQSTVSIPEQHRLTYNRYVRARADLEDELGHAPTIEHIADHLALPVPKLNQILATVSRRELMESGEGPTFGAEHDDGANVELGYRQLTPRQRQIFDYRTGSHGVIEARDDKEIMNRLGITQGVMSYELQKIRAVLEKAKAFG